MAFSVTNHVYYVIWMAVLSLLTVRDNIKRQVVINHSIAVRKLMFSINRCTWVFICMYKLGNVLDVVYHETRTKNKKIMIC